MNDDPPAIRSNTDRKNGAGANIEDNFPVPFGTWYDTVVGPFISE